MRISDWSSDVCSSDLGRRLAVAAIARIGQAVPRFTVVGIDDMAARAARLAIVTGLVVGAHEPHIGIVEARLVEVEDCDPDAQPGAGPAVRLLEVGAPRLFEPLDAARDRKSTRLNSSH